MRSTSISSGLLGIALLALPAFALQTDTAPLQASETASSKPASSFSGLAGDRWGVSYFPNVPLTRHDGREVRFFDDLIAGKVVVINFIYTTCPDVCPMETARLAEIQEILGDRIGRDVFMLSITIDPDHDTPEVLSEYRARFGARDGWGFFTGKEADILTLRKKLGLYIDEIEKDPSDHNLNMLIGNQATGHWLKRSPFDNPYVLATQIGSWLSDYRQGSEGTADMQDAPAALPNMTRAESLYRSHCLVCHRVGESDGLLRIGPNLMGITERRDPDWLKRWIKEPDAMLLEGDPIAMGLFEAYAQIPMPNLGLMDNEVDLLIEFLAAESRRATTIQTNAAILETQDKEIPECCQKEENGVIEVEALAESETAPEAPVEGQPLWERLAFILGSLCAVSALIIERQRGR